MPIRDLPLEALWKVFLAVDSPYQVYKVFPLVSRHFRDAVLLKSPVVQAQVEVLCDESETNGTLLQPLEIAKLLPTFRKIVVPVNNIFSANDSPLSPEKAQLVKINSPQGVGSISPSTVMLQSVSDDLFSGVALVEQQQMQYVGLERKIQISVGAIPDAPETLVHYLKELLGKGNIQKQSNNLQISQPAAGRLRVSTTIVGYKKFKVIFGTIEVKGRRLGGQSSANTIGSFLASMRPQNIHLWNWDAELIQSIGLQTSPPCLRIPNMKPDGHIGKQDLELLSVFTELERLEMFRPLVRQPWGLEPDAVSGLSGLPNLKELIVTSGRLVGGSQASEVFVKNVLMLKNLQNIELQWQIESRLGTQLLQGLPNLKSIQFIHISSPDVWLGLPSFYRSLVDPLVKNATLGIPAGLSPSTIAPAAIVENGIRKPFSKISLLISPAAFINMRCLGMHFMEPEFADLAIMAEGVIRCFPLLHEMTLRISRRNDGEYDFFASNPQDVFERLLFRFIERTNLHFLNIEMGQRMWFSRKSYVDELVQRFTQQRLKVRVISPIGSIG